MARPSIMAMVMKEKFPVTSSEPVSTTIRRPKGRPKEPATMATRPGSVLATPGMFPPTISTRSEPEPMKAPAMIAIRKMLITPALPLASPRATCRPYASGGGAQMLCVLGAAGFGGGALTASGFTPLSRSADIVGKC